MRLHSAIGYVTPADLLAGRHLQIFSERDRKLELARQNRKTKRQSLTKSIIASTSLANGDAQIFHFTLNQDNSVCLEGGNKYHHGIPGYLYWTHSRSKQSRAKASNPLSSMGLTGAHFLDNSDGLDHYSSRIRSRLRMERPTVAHFRF